MSAAEQPVQPVLLQESLSRAVADIRGSLRNHKLDPLRYLIDIDAGLAPFAPRETHSLRIAYNHYRELSTEGTVPHDWLVEPAGPDHDRFLGVVGDLVSALKVRVQESGRPL